MGQITVEPEASAASVAGDGYAAVVANEASWATIIAAAGTSNNDSGQILYCRTRGDDVSNTFDLLYRPIINVDISAIPATALITRVVVRLYGDSTDTTQGTDDIHIVSAAPSNPANIANADFGNLGSTSFASIAIGSISTVAYNELRLSQAGVDYVNTKRGGVLSLGLIMGWDLNASFGGSWVSKNYTAGNFDSADNASGNAPQVVLDYGRKIIIS